MGQLWTRDNWNGIIRQVNDRIEQCQAGDPLPEVREGHIWSVADIAAVRDKLTEICDNAFEFSTELLKWKQDIIDELNDAIGACDCGCNDARVADVRAIHGMASYVYSTNGWGEWHKNEWLGGDEHWHFQWTYTHHYDYTPSIGGGYGCSGMSGVGHVLFMHVAWIYEPWEGPSEFCSLNEDIGYIPTNCAGAVTSAPSGTYVHAFPMDYRLSYGGPSYDDTRWDTQGAACC